MTLVVGESVVGVGELVGSIVPTEEGEDALGDDAGGDDAGEEDAGEEDAGEEDTEGEDTGTLIVMTGETTALIVDWNDGSMVVETEGVPVDTKLLVDIVGGCEDTEDCDVTGNDEILV